MKRTLAAAATAALLALPLTACGETDDCETDSMSLAAAAAPAKGGAGGARGGSFGGGARTAPKAPAAPKAPKGKTKTPKNGAKVVHVDIDDCDD